MFYFEPSNRNAIIRNRVTQNGKLRTETSRRDEGSIGVAASTNPDNNSSQLFIDTPGGARLKLTGREARTLYRVLQSHYEFTGKSA